MDSEPKLFTIHMKTAIATILCAVFVLGCSTGRVLVSGPQHPQCKPEEVQFYERPPAHTFEHVGTVMVKSPGAGQRALNNAITKARYKAASIGANGIIWRQVDGQRTVYNWVPVDDTLVTFEAIFEPWIIRGTNLTVVHEKQTDKARNDAWRGPSLKK